MRSRFSHTRPSRATRQLSVGKTAYALGDGAPLWRLQGQLSGPGIVGVVPEPKEYVEVIDDVAVHLVTQDVGAAATAYDLATGERLWTGTLDVPARWAPMGSSVLATDGCRGTASGLDPATGEVFWRLEPVAGEVVEACEDRYLESFLLVGDVLLDSQDVVRAFAFPAS